MKKQKVEANLESSLKHVEEVLRICDHQKRLLQQ